MGDSFLESIIPDHHFAEVVAVEELGESVGQ